MCPRVFDDFGGFGITGGANFPCDPRGSSLRLNYGVTRRALDPKPPSRRKRARQSTRCEKVSELCPRRLRGRFFCRGGLETDGIPLVVGEGCGARGAGAFVLVERRETPRQAPMSFSGAGYGSEVQGHAVSQPLCALTASRVPTALPLRQNSPGHAFSREGARVCEDVS